MKKLIIVLSVALVLAVTGCASKGSRSPGCGWRHNCGY